MIVLLIALLVTAVGKFHAREPVASSFINTQPVKLPLNWRPAGITEISRELQPPLLRASTERNINKENSQQTDTDEEKHEAYQNTHIFDMSSHRPKNALPENVRGYPNDNNFGEVNSTRSTKPDNPKTTNENKATTDKTVINVNNTEVTFDERSAFTGDQCPTGFVKINGTCVEEE